LKEEMMKINLPLKKMVYNKFFIKKIDDFFSIFHPTCVGVYGIYTKLECKIKQNY